MPYVWIPERSTALMVVHVLRVVMSVWLYVPALGRVRFVFAGLLVSRTISMVSWCNPSSESTDPARLRMHSRAIARVSLVRIRVRVLVFCVRFVSEKSSFPCSLTAGAVPTLQGEVEQNGEPGLSPFLIGSSESPSVHPPATLAEFDRDSLSLSALLGELAMLLLATSWKVTGEYILLSSTGDVTVVTCILFLTL